MSPKFLKSLNFLGVSLLSFWESKWMFENTEKLYLYHRLFVISQMPSRNTNQAAPLIGLQVARLRAQVASGSLLLAIFNYAKDIWHPKPSVVWELYRMKQFVGMHVSNESSFTHNARP